MKGDRVEAVVDTGQGVQTFEIVASRAGRRIEVRHAQRVGRAGMEGVGHLGPLQDLLQELQIARLVDLAPRRRIARRRASAASESSVTPGISC